MRFSNGNLTGSGDCNYSKVAPGFDFKSAGGSGPAGEFGKLNSILYAPEVVFSEVDVDREPYGAEGLSIGVGNKFE